MKMSFVQTSLGKVAVRDSEGARGAVLLIHGNSMSSESYEPQLAGAPGRRWRLVAFDLPGHGDSPRPADPERTYSLAGYSRIVREVAASLGLHTPVLVGHSLGGHVALEAAANGFETSGLLVFSTPPLRDGRDFPVAFHLDLVGDVFFRARITDTEISKVAALIMPAGVQPPPYYARSIRATDPAARGVMGAALKRDPFANEQETLESIGCPSAVVLGELERIVNVEYVLGLGLSHLWHGSVQRVPGAGHNPQYDNPEAFNAVLTEFLLSLTA